MERIIKENSFDINKNFKYIGCENYSVDSKKYRYQLFSTHIL